MSAAAFRNLLEAGDVEGLRAAWASFFPGMPQPETREQAEIVMHHARTQANSLRLKDRIFSHRWLEERNLPSGLPDGLKKRGDRLYPVVIEAVGISINFRSPYMIGAEAQVRGAMEVAVLDAYAEGRCGDGAFITARMDEAKHKEMKALFGRLPGNG